MNTQLVNDYKKKSLYQKLFLLLLLVLVFASIAMGLSIGAIDISIKEIGSVLFEAIRGLDPADKGLSNIIIQVRLSRILSGLVVGMSLGVGGLIMQLILQNPMASPFTLGISSGAGLGAALAILFPLPMLAFAGKYVIVLYAFAFSVGVSFLILLLARWQGSTPRNLILAGIAIMNFFNAITTLLTYFADVYATREIIFWRVGTLGKSDWESLTIMAVIFIIIFPFLFFKADAINKMALGDEVAKSFGVEVKRTRFVLMIAVSLLVASATAFTGMIAFIGLVVPHVMRMILGTDSRYLIPASALGGALLLIIADTIALNIIAPIVLPVGVLTAFIGSPLFIYMIVAQKRR